MSIPTSLCYYYSNALKWNGGKVYCMKATQYSSLKVNMLDSESGSSSPGSSPGWAHELFLWKTLYSLQTGVLLGTNKTKYNARGGQGDPAID